jgi:hypothetical protein
MIPALEDVWMIANFWKLLSVTRRSNAPVFALTLAAAVLVQARAPLSAQSSASGLEFGGVTLSGSLRTRVESWDWFGGAPGGTYTYPASLFRVGFSRTNRPRDWLVELALPVLVGLPDQPVGAGPQGLGANYFTANGSANAAMLFVKQAFARFNDLGGVAGQSLKLGRMEFFDGAEVSPRNATLAAVKRDRVALRLLGNFGFTHVGRSVDGVQYAIDRPRLNVTLLAARPTRGVFQVDGWGELNVNVFYGAVTGQLGDTTNPGEWRLFGLGYHDYRDDIVKADNRPLAARRADRRHIDVGTFGGHYIRVVDTRRGPIDLLVWGAVQSGSWGDLAHRAGTLAAEAGWQPQIALAPWIRGGFDYASGDRNGNDNRHGTFFQVLPTPRLYARFPFFNMMNTEDAFGELILRPSKTLTIRADVHSLRLAEANDLWYQGGGAFQPRTFGYVGQASGGHQGLAILSDVSADLVVTPRVSIGAYYGYAAGGLAAKANYVTDTNARLGYVELLLRF